MKKTYRNSIKVESKNSKDVFILFSLLNSMGYDDENNTRGMHPLRKKVRKVLLKHDWSKDYPQLKRVIKKYHPWHLLNAILAKPKNIKKTSMLGDFILDFRRFSKEPLVRKLWNIFKTYQVRETKKLFPLFKREMARLIAFINRPPREIKKIVLVVNPLDAYWRGYGFGVGVGFWAGARGISYIVVGPGAEKNQSRLIRHELSHILAPALWIPARVTTGRNCKRLTALGYESPRIINREYVVRGLNLIYESEILKRNISKSVKNEEKNFPGIGKTVEFLRAKLETGRL